MRKELPETYAYGSGGNLEVKARNPQMEVVHFNIEKEALTLEIDNRKVQLVPVVSSVVLIASSRNMENVMAAAGKGCYSRFPASQIYPKLSQEESHDFLEEKIIPTGHLSVTEHGIFTFSVEGISRACSHQLVRHRHASYSQQSQRYTNPVAERLKNPFFNFIVPPSFRYSETEFFEYVEQVKDDLRFYINAIKKGHAEEDARMLLPNAAATNVTISLNPRALFEFASKRTCALAQWEFDMVATKMVQLAYQHAPSVFETAGPECSRTKCREAGRSCGNPVKDGVIARSGDELYPHDHLIFGMK